MGFRLEEMDGFVDVFDAADKLQERFFIKENKVYRALGFCEAGYVEDDCAYKRFAGADLFIGRVIYFRHNN